MPNVGYYTVVQDDAEPTTIASPWQQAGTAWEDTNSHPPFIAGRLDEALMNGWGGYAPD